MIGKTKAILLHSIRHSDNSLIAHFYTYEYGRLALMCRGLLSKKSSSRYRYFQPLYIFDLEIYYHENRELHNLKELNLNYTPLNIPVDIQKSTISLFISEILYAVIREEDVNQKLYEFIDSSVRNLDMMTEGISNFHLWFLVTLASYVGIGPTPTDEKKYYFDMQTGHFTASLPLHTDYMEPNYAEMLNILLRFSSADLSSLKMKGTDRTIILEKIIRYYNMHLPGMRRIRSLQVLNDIFR